MNAFAVSNADIVEALTRSSSAMAAANNTFDETVALATAAIEITRDAASVGNALKTISMRIRGYDEETEEYVGGVEELTGAIADLTKTASNTRGVSLFEADDPETYRSTYDILADIADIWDELTDKNRANLLETLFGKQRAQVGAAMLSNFEQAEASIQTMLKSAGSARAEMENIYNSLEYKLNALQETWVGVAQNLLDTELIGGVIGILQFLSNIVDGLTEKLGLFGTAGLLVLITHMAKFKSTINTINSTISPVLNTLSTMSFDGSTASVLNYASALSSLDPIQQKLAMSMAGLNDEQQEQIRTMIAATTALKEYTVGDLDRAFNTSIANKLNIDSTKRVTVEILKEAVAQGELKQEQMEQILVTNQQTAANNTASVSLKNLGVRAGAAWKSMSTLSKFSLVAGIVTTTISLISAAWSHFSKQAERAKEKIKELEDEYKELQSTISDTANTFRTLRNTSEEIIPRFAELAKGVDKFGKNVSLTDEEYAEFLDLNNQIAEMFPEINMGMDSSGNAMLSLSYSADTLTASLTALVEAERAAANAEIAKTMPDVLSNIQETNEVYRDQIDDLRDIQDEYEDVYNDILNRSLPTNVGRYSTLEAGEAAAREFIEKAQELGMHGSVMVDNQQTTNNGYVFTVEWDYSALDVAPTLNMPYIEDQYEIAIERYEKQINDFEARMQAKWGQLNPVVSSWLQTDFMFQDLNGQMQEIAEVMVSGLDFSKLGLTTQEDVQQYVDDNIVEPLFLAAPDVKEAFANIADWKEQLASGEISEDDFATNITEAFNGIFASMLPDNVESFKEIFVSAFGEMGIAGDDFETVLSGLIDEWGSNASGAEQLDNELSVLTDTLSSLRSAYDLLAKAQEDMAAGGLTAETIDALAKAEEDYLDYLYEENGVVKLNTEAWKANANAKMLGEMDEIQKEIDSLEDQNAVLQENVQYYKEQRAIGDDGGIWTNLIAEATAEIEENNKAIAEAQGQLAIYSSIFGTITGDLDVYSAALKNFSHVAGAIDNITSSFQTLADLQAQVANGFTLSLEKALEFASVYPEIMNNAQMAADGQITLNKDVVNSFIEDEKTRLNAQIDGYIQELNAEKAVLEGRVAAAQAQLELAKGVGEGRAQIAKETSQYENDVNNALTQAFIDNGIDQAEANQLANAAMAENEEEFARVAKSVFENMDDNSAKAAYNMAHNIYVNSENSATSIAGIAKQAHETAKAIDAMGRGEKAGSESIVFSGSDGLYGSKAELNLYDGTFSGTEYTYEGNTIELDDYISQLELDISSYTDAIAQIDGQIAALQALMNTPLESFQSDAGSGSSKKEIEEYLATIDQYREAVEALRKAQEEAESLESQIENAGSYEKKIALQERLIEAYKAEQDALHALNNARDATINEGVDSLRALGFAVEYNADTNEFWIENLEHLNELTADSKGEYDTLQEATNALREGTEDLIDTITDLNESNREGSATWWELRRSIIETTISMYENAVQAKENTAMLAENGMNNAIDTNNLAGVKRYAAEIIAEYQNIQQTIHEEAEYFRSLGYSDTSDEVSELSDLWWDYADNIKEVKQQVVDYLIDIVDAAHESVDEIQNVSDTLHEAADEFAANGGWITVDTYQAIQKLGTQYMQMLEDENGVLQINEERINAVIAARTRQLAVENAMAYVERIKLATQEGSIEDLNNLVFATNNATSSTWGLVYAELELMRIMGDLNDSQYQAALHNIQAMQDLAENAVANIGKTTGAAETALENTKKELQNFLDELEEMQDGAGDLVDYVMDMLKHRIEQQIDLLEEMKDKYGELIDLKKESLDAAKEEEDYQKDIADKLKEMAKLQERINALSLDDSRESKAEQAALLEELAGLQEDLADAQAEKAIETQKDSLDQMQEDYEAEKDAEIKILEESISSTQKLYDMAIEYIRNNWDTLFSTLIQWNTSYGTDLNSQITEAWEAAEAAAQRYGNFVTAIMSGISAEIESITQQINSIDTQTSSMSSGAGSGGGSTNTTVGNKTTQTTPSNEDMVKAIVSRMKELGAMWSASNDKATNDALHQQAVALANQLDQYGVHAEYRSSDGTWWITKDELNPGNVGRLLHNCYHTGGFVGDEPLKPNEQYVKAENGELVLTAYQQDTLATQIERINAMTEAFMNMPMSVPAFSVGGGLSTAERNTINNITNNSRPIEVSFGDTIINGAKPDAVKQHIKVTEDMVNQIARLIGAKW